MNIVIGKINFPIYGLLIILSLLIGQLYILIELKKEKLKTEYIFYYILLNINFTLFGGIILSIIFFNHLSSYAAAFATFICAIIFNKIVPKNNIYLKYTIISLPLMYAIGKIGCFLSGCCFGIPYNGILNVTYSNGLNIPLFPIQALESITFLIIFFISNKHKNNKHIIEITIIISAISKFLLDFLRYDHITKIISLNQILSLIVIILLIIIYRKNLKK